MIHHECFKCEELKRYLTKKHILLAVYKWNSFHQHHQNIIQ